MELGVRAQESSLSLIFSPGQSLAMPPYQRSYSWGTAEALDLLSDLLEAAQDNGTHFIGAVVFVRGANGQSLEIVDGQQRLTTLTILLCVLRDLETDSARAKALHTLIEDDAQPVFNQPARWRIVLNHVDGPFFRESIQQRGATRLLNKDAETGSEGQGHMIANAVAIADEIKALSEADRRKLAHTVTEACSVVRVEVGDKDQGFKVFRVLNTRGMEPTAHDIIKTELFQRAKFQPDEASKFDELWTGHESLLGGAAFDDLLRQIRSIYDKQLNKGDLVAGFQRLITSKWEPRKFLKDVLPAYVTAFQTVTTVEMEAVPHAARIADKLNQLRVLEQMNWRAPALKFIVECGLNHPNAPAFFEQLERLAYVLQLTQHDREARQKRFGRISDAIPGDRNLVSKNGPMAITKDEARKVRERLTGRFATFNQRRAMALRLNAALQGGRTLTPDADATVEHVLPRNAAEDSHWMTTWPNATRRREQCDTLGNFVLLTHKMNQKADRLDFRAKKEIYFNGAGGADFALTRDLQDMDAWTPDIVRKRTERLAEILLNAWEL